MTILKEVIVESIIKDLESIEKIDDVKSKRKECSLLMKRIESAEKLLLDNKELTSKLSQIKLNLQKFKNL